MSIWRKKSSWTFHDDAGTAVGEAHADLRSLDDLQGPRRLPLIGNAHLVRPANLHRTAEKWCERYGPVFRFDLGPRHFVGVGDVEAINQILRDRPDGFRRIREALIYTKEMLGTFGVFHAEGADWRHQRRLAVTALNSNHLQRYFRVISICTERLLGRLDGAAKEDHPFDIGDALTSFTVDVTSTLAFGYDLNTLERGENELQAHIKTIFEASMRRLVAPVPYWRWVRLPADRALDRSVTAVRETVTEFIEQARRRLAARPELRESPENFLESMLAAQGKDDAFSDEEILGNVFTLLFAGEDTTAHTMAWTIWALASRPGIQARWAEEACAALGGQRFPAEYEAVNEFHYGEAVLREAMRLKPVAPALAVEPLVDTEIAGVRIPAATQLLLLTRYAGLHDSGIDRSFEFDPERWLDESGSAPDQRGFLAFGAGPRFCPGRNLAFLESKAALAMIARNFEFELDRSRGPVVERLSFTMVPDGLRIRLRERKMDTAVVGAK